MMTGIAGAFKYIPFYRFTMVAAVALCCAPCVFAQSPDPAVLRRIIDQKNAEAAAATWAYRTGEPTSTGGSPSSSGSSSGASTSTPGRPASAAGAGGFGSGSLHHEETNVGDGARSSTGAPALKSSMESHSPNPPMIDGPAIPSRSADTPDVAEASAWEQSSPSNPQENAATVTYLNGQLFIHAENSSLREILQQISRLTGMVVQGGLPDERVFGDHGPARPSRVLSSLLEGTDSNRLQREDGSARVMELVLTPRHSTAR